MIYKVIISLFLTFILVGCSFKPSRVAPSVQTNTFSFFGIKKVASRTLNIPIPHPYSFHLDGEWNIEKNLFSLERNLAAFTLVKGNEEIFLRAMNKMDLFRDSTFVIEKDAADDAFIRYYLKWDHDYWTSRYEILQQGHTSSPTFYTVKKYGTIKTVNGNYQRCVFAALDGDAIYFMTGKAVDSEQDICETEIKIWESRKSF